ncbi:uncharacterized protein LOC136074105 [Hydra vulgaris]|uniref:Uncharacterized protein LOC136074105 n=1 Tax=Hydra vulgaris TaxID=6087 RepID=A0ABM4B112_HYDVU
MSKFREHYWTDTLCSQVKTIIYDCIWCKRFRRKPLLAPLTADLPKYQTKSKYPFETIGLDFAGPIEYKVSKECYKKSYIVLYTCATSRAIHLDLLKTMENENFRRSMKEMIARRGTPALIICDNAKTFDISRPILTPNMILHGKGITIPSENAEDDDDEDFNNKTTTRAMRYITKSKGNQSELQSVTFKLKLNGFAVKPPVQVPEFISIRDVLNNCDIVEDLKELEDHVDKHAEEMRDLFVNHEGKKELTVASEACGDTVNDWAGLVKKMSDLIGENSEAHLRDFIEL